MRSDLAEEGSETIFEISWILFPLAWHLLLTGVQGLTMYQPPYDGFITKNLVAKSIIILHLYPIYNLFVIVTNMLTHTKQFAFHAPITSGVYSVGFDVFTFSRPRRPVSWQDEPLTAVPVSELIPQKQFLGLVAPSLNINLKWISSRSLSGWQHRPIRFTAK